MFMKLGAGASSVSIIVKSRSYGLTFISEEVRMNQLESDGAWNEIVARKDFANSMVLFILVPFKFVSSCLMVMMVKNCNFFSTRVSVRVNVILYIVNFLSLSTNLYNAKFSSYQSIVRIQESSLADHSSSSETKTSKL